MLVMVSAMLFLFESENPPDLSVGSMSKIQIVSTVGNADRLFLQ